MSDTRTITNAARAMSDLQSLIERAESYRDALDRIARFGEAFEAARDTVPVRKGHSHAGDALVATLARYARRAVQAQANNDATEETRG